MLQAEAMTGMSRVESSPYLKTYSTAVMMITVRMVIEHESAIDRIRPGRALKKHQML